MGAKGPKDGAYCSRNYPHHSVREQNWTIAKTRRSRKVVQYRHARPSLSLIEKSPKVEKHLPAPSILFFLFPNIFCFLQLFSGVSFCFFPFWQLFVDFGHFQLFPAVFNSSCADVTNQKWPLHFYVNQPRSRCDRPSPAPQRISTQIAHGWCTTASARATVLAARDGRAHESRFWAENECRNAARRAGRLLRRNEYVICRPDHQGPAISERTNAKSRGDNSAQLRINQLFASAH